MKSFELSGIGEVQLCKRKGSKNIRLSVTPDKVKVTMPTWVPFKIGQEFALQRREWIAKNYTPRPIMHDGTKIGRYHTLSVVQSADANKASVRVNGTKVVLRIPGSMQIESDIAQNAAKRGAQKALKIEAERLLPARLDQLADTHGFSYRSVSVKALKGRWGSCSSKRDIVLNTYLMQLPSPLIDYVLLHELVHTEIMAHGHPFWEEVARHVDDLPAIRKKMRGYQPAIPAERLK